MTKTTREIEAKRNENTMYFTLILSFLISLTFFLLLYLNTPHCSYEIKEVKIIITKWDKWTEGQEIEGEKVYCDEWLDVYEHGNSFKVANFNQEKDGLCIVKQRNRMCK